MSKSKPMSGAVRLFGGLGTPESARPTVETACGLIYASTPEANGYFAMKTWSDRLTALSRSLDSMLFDKAETVAEIAELQTMVPESDSRTIATLKDLGEVLQGRLTSHSGMSFSDAGRAFAVYVVELRNHAERARFGLDMIGQTAPRPPHPSQGPAQKRSPAGTWYSQHGDD